MIIVYINISLHKVIQKCEKKNAGYSSSIEESREESSRVEKSRVEKSGVENRYRE